MKRFFSEVSVVDAADGWAIELDGRPVRTPARALLTLPTRALADIVAAEWDGQGADIHPATMPMTGLANAAIDHVAQDPAAFAGTISRYAQSDLLCYRAHGPAALIARQAAAWDPLLDWARARYDVAFVVTHGVLPVAQPDDCLVRLTAAVDALDPFTMVALSTLVTISGSLICGLAVVEGGHDPEATWHAAQVDEAWQAEQWGHDAEAAARADSRLADFTSAAIFATACRKRNV